ncbi:cupin domain-containing protein [Luteimonas terricola]|uniref:Cupin type-2 domain-containing protein n=1 Tax=Luteimonas terricola TaxID=645597 RepID=A0ABQ2EM02_9GAMM|nr:D-lyxose/D-mannose family sugar isomerase [Luteimonas terricola]GGK16512.1 hypothetical protein GCM10011394_27160 [Luteimonas terricola]
MRSHSLSVALAALLVPGVASANVECDVEAAVQEWAAAWGARDAAPLSGPVAFELLVTDTGDAFRVELPRDGAGRAVPAGGDEPATRFKAERSVYCDLASGRMNILTTMGQAHASDPTPMEADIGVAWTRGGRVRSELMPAWFNFFATDTPDSVRFGFGHGREVHGGHAVPLYYGEGLRTAWYGLEPGMHVNRDAEDQANAFDSIFIVLDGPVHARFDGQQRMLEKGESVYVPAGMRHEFWVEQGRGEFIVVMSGEGA